MLHYRLTFFTKPCTPILEDKNWDGKIFQIRVLFADVTEKYKLLHHYLSNLKEIIKLKVSYIKLKWGYIKLKVGSIKFKVRYTSY